MKLKIKATVLAAGLLTAITAISAPIVKPNSTGPVQQSPAELAAYDVQMRLQDAYPQTKFDSVRPSPMRDVYEVVMGNRIVYTNADAKLVMFGRIVDLKTQTDLTSARLQQISAIDTKKLPLTQAIKTVKGNGSRVLYVFSDPDCPYCKQLEKTLADATDVTIYTFLYPLEGLHPEAPEKAKQVWCSKNASKAWADLMVSAKQPSSTSNCKNPVEANIALAKDLNIQGTPFLIRADGVTRPGALSLTELEQYLSGK